EVNPACGELVEPVIIIPGIMGSAYKNGKWTIDPIFHVYDNLIETLEQNGYEKDKLLFTFPYDWKNSNAESGELLKQRIVDVKATCLALSQPNVECNKVDIVAHSMGGLVARSYAQSPDYQNDIDQLIFLGTPHRGAPKDYLVWEAGELFGNDIQTSFLRSEMKKDARRNGYNNLFDYVKEWPIISVQELLPTYNYLFSATTSQILNYPIGYPINNFLEELNTGLVSFLESDIDITNIVGNTGTKTISTIRIIDSDKLPLWKDGYPQGYDNITGDKGLELGVGDDTVPEYSSKFNSPVDMEITSGHINLPTDAEEEIYEEIHGGELATAVKTPIPLKILYAKVFSPIDIVIISPNGKRTGKDFMTGEEINEIPGAFYSGFNTDDEYITIPDPVDGIYKIETQGTESGGAYEIATSYISDTNDSTIEVAGTTLPNEITKFKVTIIDENTNPIDIDLDAPNTSTITISSPEAKDYLRSEKINISASAKTGVLSLSLLGNSIISGTLFDPFYSKLGTTTIFATSSIGTKAIATSSVSFRIIASYESAISDIERAYTLSWIFSIDTKNQLVDRINKAIRGEEKIDSLEIQKAGTKKITKTIEKLTKKIDKELLKALKIDLEAYQKDKLNEQAYNLIKEDLEWLINNN
ncbi:MAG: hypothetical protein AAB861_03570, partial [Patescibacteria group bacterium]